jgi:hypothetical protein
VDDDCGGGNDVAPSPDGLRRSIESAVSTLAASAPADWVSLHAEFGLVHVSATVVTESEVEPAPLPVPPEALGDIASHQRQATDRGSPWQRLIIDCDRAGRWSMRAVPVKGSPVDDGPGNERVWRVATLSGPIVIQLVLGVLLIAMWLLGKSSGALDTRGSESAISATAIGITCILSLAAVGVLVTRASSLARGIGLSVAASALIVLIGGVGVAYLLF